MRRSTYAFTIVELLVTIVILAILALITSLVFSGIQNRTFDSTIQHDLQTIAQLMETYKIDNGKYPTGPLFTDYQTSLDTIKMKLSTGAYSPTRLDGNNAVNLVYLDENTSGSNYALVARSKSKKLYYITSLSRSPKEYTGTYAAGFPAVGNDNLAGDLGLDRTANNTYGYSIYNPPSFRHWN